MNILVTGALGFIGSHLCNHLTRMGHKVIGIDNWSHPSGNKIDRVEYADVGKFNQLAPYGHSCDAIFHLAAEISVDKSIEDPRTTIETNVLGTQNILELARKAKIPKVIFASSSEVYGTAQTDVITERHPLDAQSPYAASKVAGDRMCQAYISTYGMDIFIVRNFNTFGEYQASDGYGGVIAKFVKAALRNEEIMIYGDGTQERDYMHVRDAVQAYDVALHNSCKNPVNFGTGKTVQILELATRIKDMTKSYSPIVHVTPRKGEVQRLCAGIERAVGFDFAPTTNFWEDLDKYIGWVKHGNPVL